MQHAIIFFDGVCNLCNASVRFVIKRDHKDYFRFSPLQGDLADAQLQAFAIDPSELNTILLLENGKLYKRSTAALKVTRHLSGAWPLLYGFMIVPAFIRDFFYRIIAKRRYQIWGRTEQCMVPSPDLKRKFLG